jgi:predicted kinase
MDFWKKRKIIRSIKEEVSDFKTDFQKFARGIANTLEIKEMPRIEIIEGSSELKTFGTYNPTEKKIQIVLKNRHPLDILRTLAHELIHHKQNEEGRLKDVAKEGSTGSDIENEANSGAGVILRGIAQDSPEMFMANSLMEEYLMESRFDVAKGKVIFMAGGPGSGKDFVMHNTTGGLGFVELNSDQAFEMLLDKEGLDKKMPEDQAEKREPVRARAKKITQERNRLILQNKSGVIINGTADDFEDTAKLKKQLEDMGYKTQMVFVKTSLPTAQQRNKERGEAGGRTVPKEIQEKKWKASIEQLEKYKKLFGQSVHVVDNDHDLRKVDKMTREQQYDLFYDVHRKLRHFVYDKDNENKKLDTKPSFAPIPEKPVKQMGGGDQHNGQQQQQQQLSKEPESPSLYISRARRMGLKYYGFGRFGRRIDGVNRVTHVVKNGELVPSEHRMPVQRMAEEHGAGDEATDELVKNYTRDTPGEKKKVSTKTIRRRQKDSYPTDLGASRTYNVQN